MLLEVNRSIFRCENDEKKRSMRSGSVGIAAAALILLNILYQVCGSLPVPAAALKLQSRGAGAGLALGSTLSKDALETDFTRIPDLHSHDLQADQPFRSLGSTGHGILGNQTEPTRDGPPPSHPKNGGVTTSRGNHRNLDDLQLRGNSDVDCSLQGTHTAQNDESARHTGSTTQSQNQETDNNNGAKLLSVLEEQNSLMMESSPPSAAASNENNHATVTDATSHQIDEEDSVSSSDAHHVERVFFRDEDVTADMPLVRNIIACDLSKLTALKSDAVTLCGWKQAAGRLRWLEVSTV